MPQTILYIFLVCMFLFIAYLLFLILNLTDFFDWFKTGDIKVLQIYREGNFQVVVDPSTNTNVFRSSTRSIEGVRHWLNGVKYGIKLASRGYDRVSLEDGSLNIEKF